MGRSDLDLVRARQGEERVIPVRTRGLGILLTPDRPVPYYPDIVDVVHQLVAGNLAAGDAVLQASVQIVGL